MKLFYILFFASINVFLFSVLTQKLKINRFVKNILLIYIIGFLTVHWCMGLSQSLPNQKFLILLGFSATLIIFYIMPKIVILFNNYINSGEQDELLYNWFGYWTNYVIYFLIFAFQCLTIIKN